MFTGIMAILGAICSVIAKIISYIPWYIWVCLLIFFFGGWVFHGGSCRDFACSKHRDPKPIKWQEMAVSSVLTGTSLECRSGVRERRVRSVSLSNIAAPSDGAPAEESRASLERLAGSFIRVPYQGLIKKPISGLIKPVSAIPESAVDDTTEKTIKCDKCDGTSKILDICEIDCFFCQKDPNCAICRGTGKLKLSFDVVDQCQALISAHMGDNGCEACLKLNGLCPIISQLLKDAIILNPKKSKTIQCFECDGVGKHYTEPPEAQLIVGLIYNSYGQCLNTEQVRLGMAKLLPEAPKEWKKFENEAAKNNLGVWKKPNNIHR